MPQTPIWDSKFIFSPAFHYNSAACVPGATDYSLIRHGEGGTVYLGF